MVKRISQISKSAIITLPPECWRDVKQLRLEALLDTPTAFASSYEEEAALPEEVWIDRLTTAFERDGNITFFAEVDGALVGMAGANWPARAKLRHVAEVYGVYVAPEMRDARLRTRLGTDEEIARWASFTGGYRKSELGGHQR